MLVAKFNLVSFSLNGARAKVWFIRYLVLWFQVEAYRKFSIFLIDW